jgi:hypothetical protein
MIVTFEEITYELDEYEINKILPVVLSGLKTKIGKDNAVDSTHIVKVLKGRGLKITDARLRKVIHYIRQERLITNLIATSQGYFIANDIEQLKTYAKSLKQRISSINDVLLYIEECIMYQI